MFNFVSIKYFVRAWAWKHPMFYYLFQHCNGGVVKHGKSLTIASTDIVIEGFPRCCNTFVHEAFTLGQASPLNIAHHFHAPPSVVRAVKAGKPVILLIRNPVDCVVSLVLRLPSILISDAIQSYIDFYEILLPYIDGVVVADFSDIQSDVGAIFKKVNAEFGVNYSCFEHTKENEKECFDRIDRRNAKYLGQERTNPLMVARPTLERSCLKADMVSKVNSDEYAQKMEKAQAVYELYVASAQN